MCGRYSYQGIVANPGSVMPIMRVANRLEEAKWGLLPAWADVKKFGAKLFNARAESLTQKASFRNPYKKSRCLVPMNSFYEWDQNKNPHIFKVAEGEEFFVAGLFDNNTYTVITTSALGAVAPFHARMPVIVSPNQIEKWLDHTTVKEHIINEIIEDNSNTIVEDEDKINKTV